MNVTEREALIRRITDLLQEWGVDLNHEHHRHYHWDELWTLVEVQELAYFVETARIAVAAALARKQEHQS